MSNKTRAAIFTGTKRYKILRLLGMGGMGAVYEAEDTTNGSRIALKTMLNQEPRQLLRFKQEFRVVAELHHPNLVRLFDLACEDEQWFFTMEFVEGSPLLESLGQSEESEPKTTEELNLGDTAPPIKEEPKQQESGPACELGRFVLLMSQVIDALEYLHQRKIIHRDLKPSNIIVSANDHVRLLDFGLASRVDRSVGISADGTTIGTLAYMSPEQCRGEAATERSDLYALGCMMFQLLVGAMPFTGSPSQIMQAKLTRNPPRVERRINGIPPKIAEVCYRLLLREPDARPSIDELREALELSPSTQPSRREATSFVGRQPERRALEGLLQEAAAGRLSFAMIQGKSGMGKSTLAEVILASAQRMGFLAIRGRCYERELLPFAALDRAMDALILTLSQWEKRELEALAPCLESLRAIFPAVGALVKTPTTRRNQIATPDPRALYLRATESFCELLRRAQERRPILLLLDDLQWSDRESIDLIEALLSRVQGRIFVLGLFRPEGISEAHPLQRLLKRIPNSPHLMLHLSALSAEEATQLIETASNATLDQETIALLLQQTAGNTFLTRQMASYLSGLSPEQRAARLREGKDAWLNALLGALSPKAEQLLSVAAAYGGDISRGLLFRSSALSIEDFELALSELISAHLCKYLPGETQTETSLQRLDLYHDRIREASYERLSPHQRVGYHRAIATALEATPETRNVEALLRHWTEAKEESRRLSLLVEAAEQAVEKLAFQRAIQLYEMLLRESNPSPEELAQLWEKIGNLCDYSGQLTKATEAYQMGLSAWQKLNTSPLYRAANLRLRGKIGEGLLASGKLSEGREMYAEGLSLMGLKRDRAFLSQALTLLWLQLILFILDLVPLPKKKPTPLDEEKIQFFSHMIRAMLPLWPLRGFEASLRCEILGKRVNDRQVMQRAIATKAALSSFLRRPSEKQLARSHRELDDAERLAKDYAIPLGVELVRLNRGILLLNTDRDQALLENQAAGEGLQKSGMAEFYDGAVARTYRALILYQIGDLNAVISLVQQEMTREQPNFNNQILCLGYRSHAYALLGRPDDAMAVHKEIAALLKGAVPCFFLFHAELGRSMVSFARGNFQEALDIIESTMKPMRDVGMFLSGFNRSLWLEQLLNATEGLARQEKLTPSLERKTKAWAKELAKNGIVDFYCVGYRLLALLAHRAKDKPKALQYLQAALSTPHTNPHRRLLCLETARLLNAMTPALESEAARLLATGLTLPPGWR